MASHSRQLISQGLGQPSGTGGLPSVLQGSSFANGSGSTAVGASKHQPRPSISRGSGGLLPLTSHVTIHASQGATTASPKLPPHMGKHRNSIRTAPSGGSLQFTPSTRREHHRADSKDNGTPFFPFTPTTAFESSPHDSPALSPLLLPGRRRAATRVDDADDFVLTAMPARPPMVLRQSSPRLRTLLVDPLVTPLMVVAGLDSGALALLDVGVRTITQVQQAHASAVFFTQSDQYGRLLSGSKDGLRVWAPDELLAEPQARLNLRNKYRNSLPLSVVSPLLPSSPSDPNALYSRAFSDGQQPSLPKLEERLAEEDARLLNCLHVAKLPSAAAPLTACVFLPNGRLFACDAHGILRLYNDEAHRFRMMCEQHASVDELDSPKSPMDRKERLPALVPTTPTTGPTTPSISAIVSPAAPIRGLTACASFDDMKLVTAQDHELKLWMSILQDSPNAPAFRCEKTLVFQTTATAHSHVATDTTTRDASTAASVRCILALPDVGTRGLVLTGHEDRSIRIVDMHHFAVKSILHGHLSAVEVLLELIDHRVVSGSRDFNIKVWNLATSRCDLTLRGHTGAITALSTTWHPLQLLSASTDGSCRLWNLATGACESHWPLDGGLIVRSLTLLPVAEVEQELEALETDAEMEALRLLIAAEAISPTRGSMQANRIIPHARLPSTESASLTSITTESSIARGFAAPLGPIDLGLSPEAADKDARIRERAAPLFNFNRTSATAPIVVATSLLDEAKSPAGVHTPSPTAKSPTATTKSPTAKTPTAKSPTAALSIATPLSLARSLSPAPVLSAIASNPASPSAVSSIAVLSPSAATSSSAMSSDASFDKTLPHSALAKTSAAWSSLSPTSPLRTLSPTRSLGGGSRDTSPQRRIFDASSSIERASLHALITPPPRPIEELSYETPDLTAAELALLAAARLAPPKPSPFIDELDPHIYPPAMLEATLAEQHRRQANQARADARRQSGIHAPRKPFKHLGIEMSSTSFGGGFASAVPGSRLAQLAMPMVRAPPLARSMSEPPAPPPARPTMSRQVRMMSVAKMDEAYRPLPLPQLPVHLMTKQEKQKKQQVIDNMIARITAPSASTSPVRWTLPPISLTATATSHLLSVLANRSSPHVIHAPTASPSRVGSRSRSRSQPQSHPKRIVKSASEAGFFLTQTGDEDAPPIRRPAVRRSLGTSASAASLSTSNSFPSLPKSFKLYGHLSNSTINPRTGALLFVKPERSTLSVCVLGNSPAKSLGHSGSMGVLEQSKQFMRRMESDLASRASLAAKAEQVATYKTGGMLSAEKEKRHRLARKARKEAEAKAAAKAAVANTVAVKPRRSYNPRVRLHEQMTAKLAAAAAAAAAAAKAAAEARAATLAVMTPGEREAHEMQEARDAKKQRLHQLAMVAARREFMDTTLDAATAPLTAPKPIELAPAPSPKKHAKQIERAYR